MNTPTVSVIITTYNRAHMVPESLESVLNQTVPPYQIIIVDDGSTDDTATVLEPYRDRILYLKQENAGRPSALNKGFEHAAGDLVWAFDDDDIALENAIELHLKAFETVPEAGFSYGARLLGVPDAAGETHIDRTITPPDFPSEEILLRCLEINYLPGPTTMVRKACFEKIGYFDTNFIRSADYELILRLCRRYTGVRVSEPTFIERAHSGVRGTSDIVIPFEERLRVWHEYDGRAVLKMTNTLSLEEFVPASQRTRLSRALMLRQAHFQRATILGRKSFWTKAIADINAGLEQAPDTPLREEEIQICAQIFDRPFARLDFIRDRSLAPNLRRACRGKAGRRLAFHLGRALYQSLPGMMQRKEYGPMAKTTFAALALLRLDGIFNVLRRKLAQSPTEAKL